MVTWRLPAGTDITDFASERTVPTTDASASVALPSRVGTMRSVRGSARAGGGGVGLAAPGAAGPGAGAGPRAAMGAGDAAGRGSAAPRSEPDRSTAGGA